MIPLFPELRPYPGGGFRVGPRGGGVRRRDDTGKPSMGPKGWRNCNLRTQFERIIRRAGLDAVAPAVPQSAGIRQTELAERFPIHVVYDWLGNTPDIARKHYLQTTDEHFQRALEPAPSSKPGRQPCSAVQCAAESGAVRCRNGR